MNIKNVFKKMMLIVTPLTVAYLSMVLYNLYLFEYNTSDFKTHVKVALNNTGYSLFHIAVKMIVAINPTKSLLPVFFTGMIILTALSIALFIKLMMKEFEKKMDFSTLMIMSFMFLFISKISVPFISDKFYEGSFSTQPWHNPTYMMMRAFAFVALAYYFKIISVYKEKLNVKDLVMFTVSLALTNASKPNFVFGFAPVMLCVLIKDFIVSKGKTFKNAFIFGSCVLVALIPLVFQYSINFGGESENRMAVSLMNALYILDKNPKALISLLLSMCFVIMTVIYVLLNRKLFSGKEKMVLRQGTYMYILSILIYLFVYEDGPRRGDGNFGWGIAIFALVLFVISFILIYGQYLKNNRSVWIRVLMIVLCLHILCGFIYFALLMKGYLSWAV